MAQRRPITSHPAFAPLLSLWFAALLGLGVVVLPTPLLERALDAAGTADLLPLTLAGRLAVSAAAAVIGILLGLGLALPLRRRGARDPRPIYAEAEHGIEEAIQAEPVRRPLRVREELDEGIAAPPAIAGAGEEHADYARRASENDPKAKQNAARSSAFIADSHEGFMILSPQPTHPPRPAPDLQALLDQFDSAIAAFRDGEDVPPPAAARPSDQVSRAADPVHAFVARQTGTLGSGSARSPLGGPMPDHQAELRAALDKLARAHREE